MRQLSLLDGPLTAPPRPVARTSDPESSHDSARMMIESGALGRQCAIVLELLRGHPGKTSAELSVISRIHAELGWDLDRYQVARRLSDLERLGRVRKGPMGQCSVNGRMSVTWEVV